MSNDRFAAAWADVGTRHKRRRVGTIWADYDDGDGDVTLTVGFLNEAPLMKADILGDAIGLLQREYDLAVEGICKKDAQA